MTTPLLVVGIAGGTGSGKTTLARRLLAAVGSDRALVLEQDSYYRDISTYGDVPEDGIDFDHPSAIDLDRLAGDLGALRAGRSIDRPVYDFASHRRLPGGVAESPRPLVVVEGLFVLWHAETRSRLDLKVYVDAEADLRLARRLRRDVLERGRTWGSVLDQYLRSVRVGHHRFVAPSRVHADQVLSSEDGSPDFDRMVGEIAARLAAPAEATRW